MEIKKCKIKTLAFSDKGVAELFVQGVRIPNGNGKLELTGNVGDIGKEALIVAKTLLISNYSWIDNCDYHIHFTFHTFKKDGPSWGAAAFILLSMLTDNIISNDTISATGEIDLFGNVTTVAHLDEKIEAWKNNDSELLFLPLCEKTKDIKHNNVFSVSNVTQIINVLKERKHVSNNT